MLYLAKCKRERQEKGYYEPEWDPFKSYSNPIVTKTWWGKMLRGTVHFGTMAGATVLAAKKVQSQLVLL